MKNNDKRAVGRTGVTPGSAAKKRKNALKKGVLAVCAAFVLLGVLYAVLAGVNKAVTKDKQTAEEKTPTLAGKNYINFYEPDYEADIFTDKDYLAKNRTVRYVIPGDSGSTSIVLD